MAASTAGALKAVIEASSLNLAVFRDDVGQGTPGTKYVTIDEAIAVTTEHLGDDGQGDPVTELAQVNLWQPWRAVNGGDPAEDYALPGQLEAVLHGAHLTAAPTAVRSCTVDSTVRLLERDANTVHHAITVRIRRDRPARP